MRITLNIPTFHILNALRVGVDTELDIYIFPLLYIFYILFRDKLQPLGVDTELDI